MKKFINTIASAFDAVRNSKIICNTLFIICMLMTSVQLKAEPVSFYVTYEWQHKTGTVLSSNLGTADFDITTTSGLARFKSLIETKRDIKNIKLMSLRILDGILADSTETFDATGYKIYVPSGKDIEL